MTPAASRPPLHAPGRGEQSDPDRHGGRFVTDSDAFAALDADIERLEYRLADAEGSVPAAEPVFERTT